MEEIKLKVKNIYGVNRLYPVCEKAKIFAKISKGTTITGKTLDYIKELGYEVTLIVEPPDIMA